jgi:hypothetical protein
MDRILTAVFITLLLAPAFLHAQGNPLPGTDELTKAVAADLKNREAELPIYNGRQHLGYPRSYIGIAYFMTDEWTSGSVLYEGIWYKNLLLKYDLSTDDVVLQTPGGAGLAMIHSRVQEFWLGDAHFIRAPLPGRTDPAFYQLLAQGKMTLIAFHRKVVEEKILEREVERSFNYTVRYFVVTEGEMHHIKRQKDLTRLLGEQRQKGVAEMKSKGQSFKKNPIAAMVTLVQFFNKSAS